MQHRGIMESLRKAKVILMSNILRVFLNRGDIYYCCARLVFACGTWIWHYAWHFTGMALGTLWNTGRFFHLS